MNSGSKPRWIDPLARPSHRQGWLADLCLGCALTLSPVVSHAQANTTHARQVYAATNQQLSQLQRVSFVSQRPHVEYPAEGHAWLEGATVKKIEIVEKDDSGDVVSEFYFDGAALVFLFESVRGFADSGNSKTQVTTNEERYYFREGKLFKWLSGMGEGKTDHPSASAEFAQASRSRQAAAAVFVKAAQTALRSHSTPGARR